MILELPSGLKGEARKITGDEAIKLAEAAETKTGASLGAIFGMCWVRTIDPGPYPWLEVGSKTLKWDLVVKGDLVSGLLDLRSESMPNGWFYSFPIQCQACKERYNWRIDLYRDLPRRRLPDASVQAIRTNANFTTSVLLDDDTQRAVSFRLMRATDDAPIIELMKQLDRKRPTIVESVAAQVVSIEGVNPDLRAMHRWLKTLSLGQIEGLRADFDDVDCGVETAILTTCTNHECQWQQEIELPFGRSFFRPDTPRNALPVGYVRKPIPEPEPKEEAQPTEEKTPSKSSTPQPA